jgi:hypothetical protein
MSLQKIGIFIDAKGIGDQLQFTSIPENYYKNTGEKIVDLKEFWGFDNNPYVERRVPVDLIIDPYNNYFHCRKSFLEFIGHKTTHRSAKANFDTPISPLSKPDMYAPIFSASIGATSDGEAIEENKDALGRIKVLGLRHPRLYRHEELQGSTLGTITVHTTGKSEGGEMPDCVIEQIQKNYKNYVIYQVGGKDDKPTPFIDKLGLDMWETAELIAKCQIFIGVNSGMMNIAQCYPRVNRKVVLIENDILTTEDLCLRYRPLHTYNPDKNIGAHWIDYNWQYFNISDIDMGITMSYKKI